MKTITLCLVFLLKKQRTTKTLTKSKIMHIITISAWMETSIHLPLRHREKAVAASLAQTVEKSFRSIGAEQIVGPDGFSRYRDNERRGEITPQFRWYRAEFLRPEPNARFGAFFRPQTLKGQ